MRPLRRPHGADGQLLHLPRLRHEHRLQLVSGVMGCRGVTRSDFRYDDIKDELVLLEVNTQPGMTPTSLSPEQAAHVGMDYKALVRWMVEDASCPR